MDWTRTSCWAKVKGPFQSSKFSSCGVVLVHVERETCTPVKAPLMLKGTYGFGEICCHPDDNNNNNSGLILAYFSKTMPRDIQQVLPQHGVIVKECRYYTDLPAVQFTFKHGRCIRKHRIQKWAVEELKSYSKQELERIPFSKVQQLIFSVLKCFLRVVKGEGAVTMW